VPEPTFSGIGSGDHVQRTRADRIKALASGEIPKNFVEDLNIFSDRVYRESDASEALRVIGGGDTQPMSEIFTSNTPELALGQGTNKGVLIEYSTEGLKGRPDFTKPASRFSAEQSGTAEIVIKNRSTSSLKDNVLSITIDPAVADARELRTLMRSLAEPDELGVGDLGGRLRGQFDRETLPDGKIRFTPKQAAAQAPSPQQAIQPPVAAARGAGGGRGVPGVDPDTIVTPRVGADTRFLELAAAQRGEAERLGTSAMMDAGGSGIRQFLTEAVGDIIQRMSRQMPDDYSATIEKVQRGIRELRRPNFADELERQLRSNYDFGVEKGKITKSFEAHKAGILDIQSQYAVAHSKLPVINQAHRDAQEAAVAFGEQRYADSLAALRRIESKLGSKEAFDAYRLEGAQPATSTAAARGAGGDPTTPATGTTAAARQVTPQQQAIIDDVGTGALPADDVAVDALDAAPVARAADDVAPMTPEQRLEADVAAMRRGGGGGAAPPDVQVAPLPEGTVPDLTDFGELYDLTFREGTFGFKIPIIGKNITLPKFTPRKVGEFLRLGKADPSLKAERIGQRLGHILNPLKDEGRNLVERAMSYVNELGTREGLFGKLDEFGRFTDDTAGVLKGKTLNDAERPAILRQLNPEQREYVDRLRQLSNSARELRVRAGADVGKISETEDLLFFSRGIVAKYNEAGDIIAIREIPEAGTSSRNIGGKASKARDIETMKEVTEGGYTVVPFDQRVRDQLRAAYNANAEDALVKYVKENFDTVPAGSTFEDATKLPFQNHNILIRGREGQQIATDLTESLANQAKTEVGALTSGIAKLNSVSRYFALAGDASVFTIQLIITAFGHKKAYVKALAAFADGLAKGIVSPELATKSNAERIQRSLKLANRHSTLKLGGGEFTEAFQP
jgi:hypothetical protein